MRTIAALLLYASALMIAPAAARAQTVPETTKSDSREFTNGQKNVHFIGHVEMERPETKTNIYADDVVYTEDDNHAIATGNVVVAQGSNRLAAEHAEFNTETGLGTFYNAWGIATVQPPRQQPRPGLAPPPVAGQETTVLFFGDKIEKVGPKKYRITNGGFSTCVQPTPRWDLTAGTVILNIDHYTVLENAVLGVKGVPLFYLQVMYYPTKRDGRATGFLIPTYGSSTLRGQSLHDAFFWAINRSQDATVFHDWFSKVGQGIGSEYRYNYGNTANGNLRGYFLDEHDSSYVQPDGSSTLVPGSRSFELRGGSNAMLPGHMFARASVNYFSSIQTMQTFNTNIYDASRNQRSFGGNVIGAWGTYTLNATFDRSEYFYSTTSSNIAGNGPRINFSRNERPLLGSDLYFSVSSEYVDLIRDQRQTDATGATTSDTDTSLSRFDFNPQIRFPFKKWQWFTVNSTAGWRDTYYTRSLVPSPDNPTGPPAVVADEGLNRRFYTLQTQIVGPVFNKIWDTPGNGYAEKFKHSIEPFLNVQRTSSIDNFSQIVVNDGTDFFVGGTTYQYGINNRFFAKRALTPGAPAVAREFISVELSQSYYTNQLQSQYDPRYSSGIAGTTGNVSQPSHFSAVALNVRATPSAEVNGSVRLEIDPRYHNLRTVSAQGVYSWSGQLQTTIGWSKGSFRDPNTNIVSPSDHAVNSSTTLRTRDNKYGVTYAMNYNILLGYLMQQQVTGFYNAQCCGIAFQYQAYNFNNPALPVPADHRFFLSFTLAGLGNFSPFNGALSGVPR